MWHSFTSSVPLLRLAWLVMSSFLNKGNMGDFCLFFFFGGGGGERGSRNIYMQYMQEQGEEMLLFFTSAGSLISLKYKEIRNFTRKKKRLLS